MTLEVRQVAIYTYIFTIFISTIIVFFVMASSPVTTPFSFGSYLLWLLLVVISELMPITLPRGDATLSVGGALDFGIILLFPSFWAGVAGAISGLVSSLARKVEFRKIIFNVSMGSLTLILPSEVVRIAGVKISNFQTFDLSTWPLHQVILPYLLAAMVYFFINTGLTSGAISITTGTKILDVWRTNYLWAIASFVAVVPLGFVLATVYHILFTNSVIMGILGLSIFIVPLVIMRSSFQSFVKVNNAYFGSIKALVNALDASHHYTQGHSRRVADNSVKIALVMKLSSKMIESIEKGATLHDLGKIGMDTAVLDKKGPLSNIEWASMKQHPLLGSQIISDLSFLDEARGVVLHHHERIDGKGYPSGLTGDEIPIGAKIVNAVDALDALTSERSYREALLPEQALVFMESNSGKQFDDEVVRIIRLLFEKDELTFQETTVPEDSEILFTMDELLETLKGT